MKKLLALVTLAATALVPARAEETVVYDRAPISLPVPVGTERIVTFPERVQVGVTPEVFGKVRIQTVGDTIYLKAHQTFAESRIPVRGRDSNTIFLIDLRAEEGAPSEAVIVRVDPPTSASAPVAAVTQPAVSEQRPQHGYAALTRFAAQSVYAPERLIEPLDGVGRVSIAQAELPHLVQGGFLEASPLASWRSTDGLYVTAIQLRNRTSEPLQVDPRLLRGRYATTTLHHQTVGPRGDTSDTTVAYVVHERRFEEAAQPWSR